MIILHWRRYSATAANGIWRHYTPAAADNYSIFNSALPARHQFGRCTFLLLNYLPDKSAAVICILPASCGFTFFSRAQRNHLFEQMNFIR